MRILIVTYYARKGIQNHARRGSPKVRVATLDAQMIFVDFRSRELEMGVVNFFCSPSEQKSWASQWRKMRLKWWKKVRKPVG